MEKDCFTCPRQAVSDVNGNGRDQTVIRAGVTVEFFGVVRLVAGRRRLDVKPGSLGDVLRQVVEQCPTLAPAYLTSTGRPNQCQVVLNGLLVTDDLSRRVSEGESVLLTTLDLGG